MIAAAESFQVTASVADDLGSLVGAAITQNGNLAALSTNHDDRMSPNLRSVIVTDTRDLALVSDVDPSRTEDRVEFPLEDLGRGARRLQV